MSRRKTFRNQSVLWWQKSQNARAGRDAGAIGENDSRIRMKMMRMKTVKRAET
jgi:hypothetical protein